MTVGFGVVFEWQNKKFEHKQRDSHELIPLLSRRSGFVYYRNVSYRIASCCVPAAVRRQRGKGYCRFGFDFTDLFM